MKETTVSQRLLNNLHYFSQLTVYVTYRYKCLFAFSVRDCIHFQSRPKHELATKHSGITWYGAQFSLPPANVIKNTMMCKGLNMKLPHTGL